MDIQQLPKDSSQLVFIRIYDKEKEYLQMIKQISKMYPGTVPIVLYLANEKKSYQLSVQYDLKLSEESIHYLGEVFGNDNVVIQKRKR